MVNLSYRLVEGSEGAGKLLVCKLAGSRLLVHADNLLVLARGADTLVSDLRYFSAVPISPLVEARPLAELLAGGCSIRYHNAGCRLGHGQHANDNVCLHCGHGCAY